MTDHYRYTDRLYEIWSKGCKAYESGTRGAENLFDVEDAQWLATIGATAQEVYDFCEDYVSYDGDPDFTTFALVQEVRRNYFFEMQDSTLSSEVIDMSDLPGKQEEIDGIVWLPRIIPKAVAKLKGEMDPNLMYGCGGDRRFFRENDIHPAEFLRLVWAADTGKDTDKIVKWVKARRG